MSTALAPDDMEALFTGGLDGLAVATMAAADALKSIADKGGELGTAPDAGELALELLARFAEFGKRVGTDPAGWLDEAGAPRIAGDLLWLDEEFAAVLEATGPRGKALAAIVREKSRERWRERWAVGANPWRLWHSPYVTVHLTPMRLHLALQPITVEAVDASEATRPAGVEGTPGKVATPSPAPPAPLPKPETRRPTPNPVRAAILLAEALWFDVVQPRLEAERDAKPAEVVHVLMPSGAKYVKTPKLTAGLSWATGGPVEPAPAVELDGHEYREAPGIASYIPKSWPLIDNRSARPGLAQFPLALAEGSDPLIARVVSDLQARSDSALMSMTDGKVLLFMLVTAPRDGGSVQIQKGDLAREVMARAPRGKDIASVTDAAIKMAALRLVTPRGDNLTLLTVDALADGAIYYSFGPRLLEIFGPGGARDVLGGNAWQGDFLINLTGALSIDGRAPAQLRTYITMAAIWNDVRRGKGSFEPGLAPALTLDEWATRTNAISDLAREELMTKTGKGAQRGRENLRQARSRTQDVLEALDAAGLIVLRKKRDRWTVLPPVEFHEAYAKTRARGGRGDG